MRPEITLPDLGASRSPSTAVEVTDEDIDAQLDGLRQRFATLKTVERPAQRGDYRADRPGRHRGRRGGAGRHRRPTCPTRSAATSSCPGLDDALVGHDGRRVDHASRPRWSAATSPAATPTSRSPCAPSRSGSCPSSTTSSPSWRASSTPSTSCAPTWPSGWAGSRRSSSSTRPGTRRWRRSSRRPTCPAPEGVVRDEVESRKQAMTDQLERIGASLEDYLASEGKTEEELDAELTDGGRGGRPDPAAAGRDRRRRGDPGHRRRVRARDRAPGRSGPGCSPQQYYDQLVRAGVAARSSATSGGARRWPRCWSGSRSRTADGELALARATSRGDEDDHAGHDHD